MGRDARQDLGAPSGRNQNLEMDGNLLRSPETGLVVFHQRFMAPPRLTAVSTGTPLSTRVADRSPPSVDEKATVITMPTPKPDEPAPAGDDRGPNLQSRDANGLAGKKSPAAKGDLSVG
jgi:hypothetical protein